MPRKEKKKKSKYLTKRKRKGKLETISISESPEEAALKLKYNLETTAAASGEVTDEKGVNVLDRVKQYFPKSKFYESKRNPGRVVQRREQRISTGGEKAEITYKGIQANRARKSPFVLGG